MPFLFIYSLTDFTTPPPAEAGSAAAGTPVFSLTMSGTAGGTYIEVTDNDAVLDEVDSTQNLTNAIDLDGTTYAAGTTIHAAYDLINTSNGHMVSSIHFGGDGYQQGAIDAIVSTLALQPGVTYTFDTERTSHLKNNPYDGYNICLSNGTLISVPGGTCAVEDLGVGDDVSGMNGRDFTIRMLPKRGVSREELMRSSKLRPILIRAGALGQGLPERHLRVSRQHRVLARSKAAERMFGEAEVLIAAHKLTVLPGVEIDNSCTPISYYHIVLDGHQVIYAEGALAESFFLGSIAVHALSEADREELELLFPAFREGDVLPEPVRQIPLGRRQSKLLERHLKNDLVLVAFDQSLQ